MEKMTWTRPVAAVEQFMPNEYIAKCEDTINKYFAFTCDGGGGYYGGVWQESNGTDGLQTGMGGDTRLSRSSGSYHACGETHYAPADSTDFIYNCYYKRESNGWYEYDPIEVIVWRGENNDNVHCTEAMREDIQIVTGNKS